MKRSYVLFLAVVILSSCSKSVQKFTKKGDYERAVNYAVSKLEDNKKLKKNDVKALEQAHREFAAREVASVRKKALDPSYDYPSLYNDIVKIDKLQKKLYPYLPIVSKKGYRANFQFVSTGRLLEDSFKETTSRDVEAIKHLKASQNYLEAYFAYKSIDDRQLFIARNPKIVGVDGYKPNIVYQGILSDMDVVKVKALDQTYKKGIANLEKYRDVGRKQYAVEAYENFRIINDIDDNYRDSHKLLEEARDLGIVHVLVKIENRTYGLLPMGMEYDILGNGFQNLDEQWVKYYGNDKQRDQFDVISILEINKLDISPELENTTYKKFSKKVKDGWEYALDSKGNVAKDTLGNDIKKDKFINAKAKLFSVLRSKYAQLDARVVYHNVITNATKRSNALDVKYVFEDEFYEVNGDERALGKKEQKLLKKRPLPYPTDEDILRSASGLLREKLERELSEMIYYDSWFRD